jgi:hypothetical protein
MLFGVGGPLEGPWLDVALGDPGLDGRFEIGGAHRIAASPVAPYGGTKHTALINATDEDGKP